MNFIKGVQFGLKQYSKHGIMALNKSNFGDSGNIEPAIAGIGLLTIFILAIVSIIIGYIAVGKICTGTDTRSKNIRLGMYALLILTGGSTGFLYLLLWIFKVNVCA
uniref:Uncharacterized protein n=1 Tax=viral metagenome TaxID=1070528 RepID=A0A6C0I8S8_9ZZZZ